MSFQSAISTKSVTQMRIIATLPRILPVIFFGMIIITLGIKFAIYCRVGDGHNIQKYFRPNGHVVRKQVIENDVLYMQATVFLTWP